MRVAIDYRPALRARSGVGEYVHQVARALTQGYPDDSWTLFTSSRKDRPDPGILSACVGAQVSDHRVPVAVLNFAWHWLEWPPIELMAHGSYDVAFSPHPLLMPARHAAQVVMIHDLDFLQHPERTHREIRRDYPRLVRSHARRAQRVVVPSRYTASEVMRHLGLPSDAIVVAPPGIPEWREPRAGFARDGYVLFMGTLEPRKNLAGLIEAFGRLCARRADVPNLVLAGRADADAQPWLDAIRRPPLAGRVELLGYIEDHDRQRIYAGARVLVLPSFEEGFGMPALEAMSLGIPVIASERPALSELVADAGLFIVPEDVESIVAALDRVLTDPDFAESLGRRGLARSRLFQWRATADAVRGAFRDAMEARSRPS